MSGNLWEDVFGGGGGSGGGGFVVPNSATLPFADNTARDTWASANLNELVENQTVVEVTGSPDNVWYLWRGDTNPSSYNSADWIDATPIIRGPAGPNGDTDLGNTPAASTLTVTSSTGNDTVLPAATTSAAGVMTGVDKTNLNANTAKVGFTVEAAQDAIGNAINEQKGIDVVYDDARDNFNFFLKSAPVVQNSNYDIAYDDEFIYYTGTTNVTYDFSRVTSSTSVRDGLQYWIYNNGTGTITLTTGVGAVFVGGVTTVPPSVMVLVTYRLISGSDDEILVYAFPDQVQANWSETNTNSPAFIQNKPTIPSEPWRSTWNNSTVYQAGDMVRHLSEGAERVFLATTAINSGQPPPPSGPAIGAWVEIDVKAWRGVWNSGNSYRAGDETIHTNAVWKALTTIAIGGSAPSSTNPNWVQIDGGGGGVDKGTTFPTTGLSEGDLFYHTTNEILYQYDGLRSKWLSVAEMLYHFGVDGAADNRYLNLSAGVVTAFVGYQMPRSGTIVGVSGKAEGNPSKSFDVEVGATPAALTFSLSSGTVAMNANTNFSAGDDIQIFANSTGAAALNPVIVLHVRWR